MTDTTSRVDFDDRDDLTSAYERVVHTFIPGYAATHDLAAVLIAEQGDVGHLLVVGAGGGAELARFAAALPGWSFTAVDPSQVMLDKAVERATKEGFSDRATFILGVSRDAPDVRFDAATAFLALMFAPDDGERLAQLRAIHRRLRPGAPFLMVHSAAASGDFERQLARYAAHAHLRGAEPAMLAEAVAMQRSGVAILSPERESELLREAGFSRVEEFYRAFWIHGWSATA